MAEVFKRRVRELLEPQHERTVRLEGPREAERMMGGRLRVAVDYARMQRLIPAAKKKEKEESDVVCHTQVDDFSPEEKKKCSKDHNVACLTTFVDVLADLACEQWREKQEITIRSLRQGVMGKKSMKVKGYWETLTGRELFQYV